jgi:sugar O-acyltransferase (sialic acid O-acetyltransferase NeuD family)
MAKVVVFGVGQVAEVAYFYLTHDSEHEVVAFTVNRDYLDAETFQGLPVVPFEDLTDEYPATSFKMFVPISYQQVNRLREAKYHEAKAKGYELISYVSSKITTWPGFTHGDNCFLLEDNTIQPFVSIGSNVILWSGNHIGHHTTIEDHCFLASQIVISGAVVVGERTFIGVNATLRDNITIAPDCVIGAGALVLKSTEPRDVVVGQAATTLDRKSDQLKRI